jgi:hypothetical protein
MKEYHFFTPTDVEMPFPLEMRDFTLEFFNKSIKKSLNIKEEEI